jgi:hypothetical protein
MHSLEVGNRRAAYIIEVEEEEDAEEDATYLCP